MKCDKSYGTMGLIFVSHLPLKLVTYHEVRCVKLGRYSKKKMIVALLIPHIKCVVRISTFEPVFTTPTGKQGHGEIS